MKSISTLHPEPLLTLVSIGFGQDLLLISRSWISPAFA